MLFPDLPPFASVALHCSGNVARALTEAVGRGGFPRHAEAAVLAVAAAWSEAHPEEPVPGDLIARARTRARELVPDDLPAIELASVARRTQDPGLRTLLEKAGHGDTLELADKILEPLLTASRASPLAHVPEQPKALAISGYTVRRAAPRVGRNDPCPCGSGKKYKKCCYDKDQERLLHPSAVPGLTVDEWRDAPELALTEARLEQMRAFELTRLDPLKIPDNLRWLLLDKLVAFEQIEPAVAAFEKLGYKPTYRMPWRWSLRLATRSGRKDLVERLLSLRSDTERREDCHLSTRLLLAENNGSQLLDIVESEARAALQEGGSVPLVELAYSMLESRAPSLGILVARSVLPVAPFLEALTVFDEILQTRDRLQLPPDDPFDDILDERLPEPEDETGAVSEELQDARASLQAKSEEVGKLAQELQRLRRELEQREASKASQAKPKSLPTLPSSAPHDAPAAVDERTVAQMRQRIDSLRDTLKERHMERNQLRRELQTAHAQIQALHETTPEPLTPSAPAAAASSEDDLLLAHEEFSNQPVRIPDFPKKFQDTVAGLPKPIARACLGLIGRMAGGDPAAFAGSKRLKTAPNFHRQRIGADYRLLFRLHPDRFEVIDLIHRRDLERKIKTLT